MDVDPHQWLPSFHRPNDRLMSPPPKDSDSPRQLKAVVLAGGRGSRMVELTRNRPKCLLPVGNHPILYHALKVLESAEIDEAIVVVTTAAESIVNAALARCTLSFATDVVTIPDDEDWGTTESLRRLAIQGKIKSSVIVISCDIFTNGNVKDLLKTFRETGASIAALLFEPLEDDLLKEAAPGDKDKNKPEKDIIAIDSETSRLAILASASDFEELVPIRRSILRRYADLSLRTDLVDGHIYVISSRVVKFLARTTGLSTLKGEFLPYIVGRQHKRPKPTDGEREKLLFACMEEDSVLDDLIQDVSSYHDHRGDLKSTYHGDSLRCFAVIADRSHFGIRINSVLGLWQANRLATSAVIGCLPKEGRVDPSAEVLTNQIEDSFVGVKAKIRGKTSARSSVLADLSSVHPKTRITKCIVLRKADIKEGCSLENCIIGNSAVVGENCILKNCVVGDGHTVPPATAGEFLILSKSDSLMEI